MMAEFVSIHALKIYSEIISPELVILIVWIFLIHGLILRLIYVLQHAHMAGLDIMIQLSVGEIALVVYLQIIQQECV